MTTLAERRYDLGLGHVAEVEIRAVAPAPAPETGIDWPEHLDWPRAELEIRLPAMEERDFRLHRDLVCDLLFLGEVLSDQWGFICGAIDAPPRRFRRFAISRRTLDEAVAELLWMAEAEIVPLRNHVRARETRLRRREQALNAARTRPSTTPATEVGTRITIISARPTGPPTRFDLLEPHVAPEPEPDPDPASHEDDHFL